MSSISFSSCSAIGRISVSARPMSSIAGCISVKQPLQDRPHPALDQLGPSLRSGAGAPVPRRAIAQVTEQGEQGSSKRRHARSYQTSSRDAQCLHPSIIAINCWSSDYFRAQAFQLRADLGQGLGPSRPARAPSRSIRPRNTSCAPSSIRLKPSLSGVGAGTVRCPAQAQGQAVNRRTSANLDHAYNMGRPACRFQITSRQVDRHRKMVRRRQQRFAQFRAPCSSRDRSTDARCASPALRRGKVGRDHDEIQQRLEVPLLRREVEARRGRLQPDPLAQRHRGMGVEQLLVGVAVQCPARSRPPNGRTAARIRPAPDRR